MDARLLMTFRIVVENQSMTAAAEILGLTQPAVSAQISRLETQIGFALFERVGTKLKVTDKGRWYYDEVVIALGVIDRLAETANVIRGGAAETLVIASHPSASISLLPSVIAEFLDVCPGTQLRLINRMSDDIVTVFESGGCDIGIAQWPITVAGADNHRYKVRAVAILPKGHPLAEKSVINVSDFSGLPFIEPSQNPFMNHVTKKHFSDSGLDYRPVIQSEYFGTICGLVAAGCGVSIVDPWSAKSSVSEGIEIRPFEPETFYEIVVFCRSASKQSPLVSEFLKKLDSAIQVTNEPGPDGTNIINGVKND
jgi:DNA-binding transcriptional LysR family regulator